MAESTIKNIGFNTSVFTGASQRESTGEGLAKVLMTGAQAYEKKLNIDYKYAQREKQREAEERAAKARTDRENKELDFIDDLDYNTRYGQWKNDNDYVNLTSEERRKFDTDFDADNDPIYRTNLYKAKHRSGVTNRDLGHDTLMQEENKVASFEIANKLIADNLGMSNINFDEDWGDGDNVAFSIDEQIRDLYDNIKTINKDITYKQFLGLYEANVFNEIQNNQGKFANMTADETDAYFSSMNAIEDKKLRANFDKFINGKRVEDIVNSGMHMDGNAILEASKKSGVPTFAIWDAAKKMNESRVPILLQGSNDDVEKAVGLYEDYGMDEKVFHTATKSAINRGNLNLYYNLRDKVMMSDDIAGKVSGYEFLARRYGYKIDTKEGLEQIKKAERDTANAGFKLSDKEKSKLYKGLTVSEKSFYRKNEAMASRFAADADDLEDVLEDMFDKQSVDGIPSREINISTDTQKDIVIDYIRRTASGQERAEYKLVDNGYEITTQDDKGNDALKFQTVDDMNILVKDAYEFNEASLAADAILSDDTEYLNRRIVRDVKIVKDMIKNTQKLVFEEYKDMLTDKEKKILDIMIKEKYSDLVKGVKDRNAPTLYKAVTSKFSEMTDSKRGFEEVGEAFSTWKSMLFGGEDKVAKKIRKKVDPRNFLNSNFKDKKEIKDGIEFLKSRDTINYDKDAGSWYYIDMNGIVTRIEGEKVGISK